MTERLSARTGKCRYAAAVSTALLLGACATQGVGTNGETVSSLAPGLDPAFDRNPFPSTYRPRPSPAVGIVGAAILTGTGSEIAAADVTVIVNPVANTPFSFETLGATLENAARLHAAGVLIAIEGNGAHRSRETRYNAGNAVASGLPWQAALEAITINPARIFGVGDRIGSLEVGKEADLVIWDGDPVETLTRPVAIFIHGERQPMTSRATELRDRYLPAVKSLEGR